jgi:hypothetical protein
VLNDSADRFPAAVIGKPKPQHRNDVLHIGEELPHFFLRRRCDLLWE